MAATGVYQQFPAFEQVIGAWGTPGLDAERATHLDVGVEQAIGQSARVQVTLYDREEKRFPAARGRRDAAGRGRLVPASTNRPLREPHRGLVARRSR